MPTRRRKKVDDSPPIQPNPLVQFKNADEVQREIDRKLQEQQPSIKEPFLTSLANHIRSKWQQAQTAKIPIEVRLNTCKRAIKQQYEPKKLAAIQAIYGKDFDPPYPPVIATKHDDLVAWLKDSILMPGVNMFSLEPTPMPELPMGMNEVIAQKVEQRLFSVAASQTLQTGLPVDMQAMLQQIKELQPIIRDKILEEIKQKSKEAIRRMEKKIKDQFVEGGFYEALLRFMDDIATYPNAFLKGPIQKKVRVQRRVMDLETGQWVTTVTEEIVSTYERRSPYSIYPVRNAGSINDTDVIDLISHNPDDLSDLIGVWGYDSEAIREVLRLYREGGLREWTNVTSERDTLEDKDSSSYDLIDCIEYQGTASGRMLTEWAGEDKALRLFGQELDPEKEYQIIGWLIGTHVIKAMLNPDPLGHKNISMTSCYPDSDNFWSPSSLPEKLWSDQSQCNALSRAIVLNVGFACLTGDTIVYRHEKIGSKKKRNRNNKRSKCEITLNHLWKIKNGERNNLTRNKIRSLDESTGKFYGNKILDIVDNGVRPVYRVTTKNGYSIKATLNHRFMREDGSYQELEDFKVGSLIAVNGRPRKYDIKYCIDCGELLSANPTALRCKSCAGKISSWNMLQKQRALENPSRWWCDCKAKEFKKNECENCKSTIRLHLHHINGSHFNYHKENLLTLCEPCHKKWHMEHDFFGDPFKHTYVDYDEITEIRYVGEEQVFDLQMESPNHNFVANGFISHNSGPQVEYDIDRFPPDVVPSFYPLKIWSSTGSQMATGRALNFYQPQLVVAALTNAFEFYRSLADEHSGIPRFMQGDRSGMAATASGFSMQLAARARGLKSISMNIYDVISKIVSRQYQFNLEYEDIEMIGDCKVVPSGLASIIAKEQLALRRREYLNEVTTNPVRTQLIGGKGLRYMERQTAQTLEFDLDKIFGEDSDLMDDMINTTGLPAVNRGTPPTQANIDAAGDKAGGVDAALFNERKGQSTVIG